MSTDAPRPAEGQHIDEEGDLDCSSEAVVERLDYVRELLAKGHHDGEIRKLTAQKFGCAPRTVHRYLTTVRGNIREETGRDVTEMRGDSLEFYRGILTNPNASVRDKIRAREAMDKILGLNLPEKKDINLDVSGNVHDAMKQMENEELTDEELEVLAKAGDLLKKLPQAGV